MSKNLKGPRVPRPFNKIGVFMYKVSKYNIIENIKDGILIYNTFSGCFLFVDKDKKNEIVDFLKNPKSNIDFETLNNFLEAGFIIRKDFDEIAELKKIYLNSKKNKDSLSIVVLASESCNFSCPYCFIKEKRGFNMKSSVYKSVLNLIKKNIKRLKNLKIQIFGGEPLLNHRNNILFLKKLNNMIKKYNINKEVVIITNGYALNLKVFEEYLNEGCNNFQITLDGYSEIHNSLRYTETDKDTFKRILNNINEIKKSDENFKMTLRINFPELDKDKMVGFVDFLSKNFYEDERFQLYFRQIVDYRKDIKNLNICSKEDGIKNQFEYSLLYYKKTGIDKNKIAEYFMPKPISKWCDAGSENHYIIGADGLIFKCDVEIGGEEFGCGKLKDNGEVEIYSKTYHQKYSPYNRKKCKNCVLLPICQGGCAYSYKNTGKCFYTGDFIRKIMRDFHYNFNN